MIRIAIADDHALVRAGLGRVIQAAQDMEVVAEAASGDEILTLIGDAQPDVLLLDVSMPGKPFTDVITRVGGSFPKTSVLVVSMHPEELYAVRALKAGASGYINKDSSPEVLAVAIRQIHRGGLYVSPALAQQLATQAAENGHAKHEKLSQREFEVLRLLGSGRNPGHIAQMLNLSPKTVGTYRARLLEKLGLDSTADLIRYAITRRLDD